MLVLIAFTLIAAAYFGYKFASDSAIDRALKGLSWLVAFFSFIKMFEEADAHHAPIILGHTVTFSQSGNLTHFLICGLYLVTVGIVVKQFAITRRDELLFTIRKGFLIGAGLMNLVIAAGYSGLLNIN